MIDVDPRGAFVSTHAGVRAYERGWTHRWRLCVGERAMAPILESYGHQRRDQNVRTGVAERSGASTH